MENETEDNGIADVPEVKPKRLFDVLVASPQGEAPAVIAKTFREIIDETDVDEISANSRVGALLIVLSGCGHQVMSNDDYHNLITILDRAAIKIRTMTARQQVHPVINAIRQHDPDHQ